MGSDWQQYLQSVDQLQSRCNFTTKLDVLDALDRYRVLAYKSDEENKFGKPMPWIGIYIAVASLFCILPMVVDLLHGFRNRKLWFPNKYFTLNAASLTVIAIAMKLPMDLNNPMPGAVDQAAKIGSIGFMCTMMANLLPSLSTMDNKELLANIIALGVLVITLVVNVCIQIKTGVIIQFSLSAIMHVVLLLMSLIIHICSSLVILKSKQILESKYQAVHETNLKEIELQQTTRLTVEKLKQHVNNYWIMAATGSPQFMTTCLATTSASGVVCALSIAMPVNWLKAMFSASGNASRKSQAQLKENKVLSQYVLQLQDDMELAERTLKGISKSVNHLIQKAEKQQPNNLMKLLEKSRGFEGVERYNSYHVPPLLAQEFLDCWSLALVTLTTIAISLPDIQKDIVDTLQSNVSEGLVYVTLVEENLNATDGYVNVQKAAKTLWLEVEIYHKWLGNKLQKPDPQVNNAEQILQWFRDTAKSMVTKVENTNIGGRNDDSMCRSISANSMYRITETILLSYHENVNTVGQKELFEQLSSMISDILAACLTNLPQVIAIKCHTNAIEKREASVHDAAQLLGETMQIIRSHEDHELPSLNQDELAFIDNYSDLAYQIDLENKFGKPMLWIGIYIAIASLFCIIAMVADILHGLRNRKLWFPCKYFTINAASLTVIAVAIKLPMDLNNPMPGDVDKAAKLGSLAFTCTMMANLLPSLSTMDNNELIKNGIALVVLVITLLVNVCIQIKTGVLAYSNSFFRYQYYKAYHLRWVEIIYVAMLFMLLLIHICSSLAILKSKEILESQYQAAHQTASMVQELQQTGSSLTVEKLKQLVRNYWIMAATGSPQFMTACSPTTSASGVICALSIITFAIAKLILRPKLYDFDSAYQWSILVILITQSIGVVFGSIAPISRCFASLSFKFSMNWIRNHIKVFRVESYWTEKLYDLTQSSIPFPFRCRNLKIVIQKLITLILSFCIGFQKAVVVACKLIALVPIFIVIGVLYCFRFWKWLKAMLDASGVVVGKRLEQLEQNNVLSQYVLQLQDDMELAERTLKDISKFVNSVIRKAEKQQPNNLMKLLEKSKGFEGVEKYFSHHVPPLLAEEFPDCWSLSLVTLTTIAVSLPNIQNNLVNSLLSSVSDGLVYVTLVEESLNAMDDYLSIQKAAKMAWLEVEVHHKWLGNKLHKPGHQANTANEILQWLRDTAKNMVTKVESMDIGGRNDDSIYKSISANSMYRIAETILVSHHANIEEVSQEELFEQLSSMISDILAACLTNLPRVIAMKCHTCAIEKREESVCVAAHLLGETTQIINNLQDRELPNLKPNELAFIDKWRAYFKHPYP
ncbi:hypothetical protein OSB04_009371 [Centaurea solstitialis]|uniref:Uncharacterized protein n=1 Tax=Centaurea solstitialis TaxID=347529 RepID=A0AA38TNK4_9ASTR|nr:hypothetical protein OSB04_009371 [Centaurea solstitialis]